MAGEAGAAWGGVKGQQRRRSPASVLKDEEGAGWAEWAKRPCRSVRRLGRLGQKLKEIPFGIKIRFVNLHVFWKFVQGDLGGILTQGFFLNSSRIFRKYNMP
jgi:hypothetical protein